MAMALRAVDLFYVSLAGTTLRTSDAVVRELVSELSANPTLAAWLANEDLIRRFVAAVDNVANGISPTTQLDFMRPEGSFDVIEKGQVLPEYHFEIEVGHHNTLKEIRAKRM